LAALLFLGHTLTIKATSQTFGGLLILCLAKTARGDAGTQSVIAQAQIELQNTHIYYE